MKKRWAARPAPMLELSDAPRHGDLPASISLLLARRGFAGERLRRFLAPEMVDLSDWKTIPGMEEAASRIASAVGGSRKILVHGDFDADGITATTTVYLALSKLGADVDYFIPDRFDDGYGLSEAGVKACADTGAEMLLTVDCGISDTEHVAELRGLGVETVITDHHQPGDRIPEASAVVDPAMHGEAPWSRLSGVGVAWMAMRGVYRLLGEDIEYLRDLLQLVAVGTVADVVELVDDNRILVSQGLKLMRSRPLPGMAALAGSASIETGALTSTDIAYYIGPRLNACGRIGHARDAVELLLASDAEEARLLAAKVEGYNRQRRKLDKEVEEEVLARAAKLDGPRCIVMADGGWHRGVIGIVASRLVRRYGVPSLMIAVEDGTGYGSARSVPGIPIHSILRDIQAGSGIMSRLGGHPMAAGFSLPEENIDILGEELREMMSGSEWDEHLGSVLYLDGRLEESDFNAGTARALEMLEPFGEGNRKPVWLARGAFPLNWRTVGKDNTHLSCSFRIGSGTYRAIGFNMAGRQSVLGGRVDLAFVLALDTWRNDGSVQLVLRDIRKHRGKEQ